MQRQEERSKDRRAVLQFYPFQKFQNKRTSFFKRKMSLAESWARRSRGRRKVPATLAPRSAMALINGSRLVRCCCSSIGPSCNSRQERYTHILVGGQVLWRFRRRRTSLEQRSQRRFGPLTVTGSFPTRRTASRQWLRQRTKCMLPDGHMHESTATITNLSSVAAATYKQTTCNQGAQRDSPRVQKHFS